ncbi:lipid-A-disaccharide synthase [Pelovirga terrestris]|uniref:lipid-A-disaccharide synthase n=1 Tax=Pelovirga terrestris TaxID=2771352 RepID=UPI001CD14F00|nr:lipid-A-disaccharide synthase [Pelovirga terrestris]
MSISSATSRVMIVAGESSGDLHGSNLLKAAAEKYPNIRFFGVGGRRMQANGCDILIPSDELSVMGVTEVLGRLPGIILRFRRLAAILKSSQPPDLLVLVDFPDFNLRLAKVAKHAGVPVLYYISPKVWAWRSGRARTIAERVDRLALIFPFEPEIYAPFKVRAEYVGNPLLDEFAVRPQGLNIRKQLHLSADAKVVGIFPGSRQSELNYIFATLVMAAKKLHEEDPRIVFIMPVAPSLQRSELENRINAVGVTLPIYLVEEDIYAVADSCQAVLTVSGTVTLQLALVGTPMAIVYKVAPLSYAIGRRLIKIPFAGLPNIIAGRDIVREFIQDDAQPEALKDELLRLLDDVAYIQQMRDDLVLVQKRLGAPGCSIRVADMVAEMVGLELKEGA